MKKSFKSLSLKVSVIFLSAYYAIPVSAMKKQQTANSDQTVNSMQPSYDPQEMLNELEKILILNHKESKQLSSNDCARIITIAQKYKNYFCLTKTTSGYTLLEMAVKYDLQKLIKPLIEDLNASKETIAGALNIALKAKKIRLADYLITRLDTNIWIKVLACNTYKKIIDIFWQKMNIDDRYKYVLISYENNKDVYHYLLEKINPIFQASPHGQTSLPQDAKGAIWDAIKQDNEVLSQKRSAAALKLINIQNRRLKKNGWEAFKQNITAQKQQVLWNLATIAHKVESGCEDILRYPDAFLAIKNLLAQQKPLPNPIN